MNVQVLVAALNQEPRQLADEMKLNSDAIIINQCDRYEVDEWKKNGHTIKGYSMPERGVGLSRNTAMMRAEGDICLFSDQDIIYEEDYAQKIVREFEKNPDADIELRKNLGLIDEENDEVVFSDERIIKSDE